jgi:hypothetical protein
VKNGDDERVRGGKLSGEGGRWKVEGGRWKGCEPF